MNEKLSFKKIGSTKRPFCLFATFRYFPNLMTKSIHKILNKSKWFTSGLDSGAAGTMVQLNPHFTGAVVAQ